MANQYMNGCDFYPEGITHLSWKVCCDAHDVAYSIGGSLADKLAADFALAKCADTLAGMGFGGVMGLATLLVGGLFFNFKRLGNKSIMTLIKEKFRARV